MDWKGMKSMSCSSVSLSTQSLSLLLPPLSALGFSPENSTRTPPVSESTFSSSQRGISI